jgi:hypothetical protein
MKPRCLRIPFLFLSLFLSLFLFISLSLTQKIYIDSIPGYSSLSPCASTPLSTIVHDMASGCTEGGKTSSYSCFCTASSSAFSKIISSAVTSMCTAQATPTAEANQALEVFSVYCQLGRGVSSGTSQGLLYGTRHRNPSLTLKSN